MTDDQLLDEFQISIGWYERVDHLSVEQRRVQIKEITNAARHAGCDIAPCLAEYHRDAAGHVLAPVIAQSLHHRNSTRVPDAEPLADLPADEQLTGRRAVSDHIAGDDVVCGDESSRTRRPHHNAATREPFSQVVVSIAFQAQRDAGGQECPEALSSRAFEGDVDRAIRKTLTSGGFGHLVTQDRSHRPIDVTDRYGGTYRLTGLQRGTADPDQLLVQRLRYSMIMNCDVVQHRAFG